MVLGDPVWFSFTAFGLAAWAWTLHGVFVAVKYPGAACLRFMAWKPWTAKPSEAEGKGEVGAGLELEGLKFVSAGPHMLDLDGLDSASFVGLSGAMPAILFVAMAAHAPLAARAMIRDAQRMKTVDRGSALARAGAIGAVAIRWPACLTAHLSKSCQVATLAELRGELRICAL